MKMLKQRLDKLERNEPTASLVIVSEYINSDGTAVGINGYCLPNGEKILRSITESAAACEGRAIERALQVAGGAPIHLEAQT